MKKVVLVVAILAVIVTEMTGCGAQGHPFPVDRNSYKRFRVVETYGDGAVLVDKDTGIGYFRYWNGGHLATFPLYDQDGELYRPNGWRDYGG